MGTSELLRVTATHPLGDLSYSSAQRRNLVGREHRRERQRPRSGAVSEERLLAATNGVIVSIVGSDSDRGAEL